MPASRVARTKVGVLAVFGLALAALVLPGAASALVNPSILHAGGRAVLGVGAEDVHLLDAG